MKSIVKHIVIAIAIVMVISDVSGSTSLASNVGNIGNNTDVDSGYNKNGTTDAGSYQFEIEQSGYRMYLIDQNGNRVSNIVDLVYSVPDVTADHTYVNAYNEALISHSSTGGADYTSMTWDNLANKLAAQGNSALSSHIPLMPLDTGEGSVKYSTKGAEFKQWVIDGIGGSSFKYLQEMVFPKDTKFYIIKGTYTIMSAFDFFIQEQIRIRHKYRALHFVGNRNRSGKLSAILTGYSVGQAYLIMRCTCSTVPFIRLTCQGSHFCPPRSASSFKISISLP